MVSALARARATAVRAWSIVSTISIGTSRSPPGQEHLQVRTRLRLRQPQVVCDGLQRLLDPCALLRRRDDLDLDEAAHVVGVRAANLQRETVPVEAMGNAPLANDRDRSIAQ